MASDFKTVIAEQSLAWQQIDVYIDNVAPAPYAAIGATEAITLSLHNYLIVVRSVHVTATGAKESNETAIAVDAPRRSRTGLPCRASGTVKYYPFSVFPIVTAPTPT